MRPEDKRRLRQLKRDINARATNVAGNISNASSASIRRTLPIPSSTRPE